jgi:hypothetical protein
MGTVLPKNNQIGLIMIAQRYWLVRDGQCDTNYDEGHRWYYYRVCAVGVDLGVGWADAQSVC